MKKLFTLLAVAVFASSTFASSEHINLRDEMMVMSQRLVFAVKSDNTADFQNNLSAFIDAAEKSKETIPPKWNGDKSQLPGYQQGLQKVIDLAKEANGLAQQGKLDEAKAKLDEMPELRKTYHMLYK